MPSRADALYVYHLRFACDVLCVHLTARWRCRTRRSVSSCRGNGIARVCLEQKSTVDRTAGWATLGSRVSSLPVYGLRCDVCERRTVPRRSAATGPRARGLRAPPFREARIKTRGFHFFVCDRGLYNNLVIRRPPPLGGSAVPQKSSKGDKRKPERDVSEPSRYGICATLHVQ